MFLFARHHVPTPADRQGPPLGRVPPVWKHETDWGRETLENPSQATESAGHGRQATETNWKCTNGRKKLFNSDL
jgi:hypothetical protein